MRDLIRRIKQAAPDYLRLTREEIAKLSAYLVQHGRRTVTASRYQKDPDYKREVEAWKEEIQFLKAVLTYNQDLSADATAEAKHEDSLLEPAHAVAMIRGIWAKYSLDLSERQARHLLEKSGKSVGGGTRKRGGRVFSKYPASWVCEFCDSLDESLKRLQRQGSGDPSPDEVAHRAAQIRAQRSRNG